MLTLNAACSRRKVFGVSEMTVLKKKTWNTNLTAWGFSYLHYSHLKQHGSYQPRQHKTASYCQYFFSWCVQNLIPLHLLQRHFGWVSAACLVKRGCCLWFWIEWEQTCPLLQHSPGFAVSHVLILQWWSVFPCSRNALQLAGGEISDPVPFPSVLSFSCQLAPGISLFTRLLFPGCYSTQGAQVSGGFGFPGWGQGGVGQCRTNLCIPAAFMCATLLLTVMRHVLCCGRLIVFPQGAERSENSRYCS